MLSAVHSSSRHSLLGASARSTSMPLLRPSSCSRLRRRVLATEEQRHAAEQCLRGSPEGMYEHALELARQQRVEQARDAFELLLQQHPHFCKAWVSFAQMEKRMGRLSDPLRMIRAREILQRGLSMNPDSGCLAQAWGLMELQKGNMWAAVRLLERSVDMDPFLQPVLRWKPVSVARMTVAGSSARQQRARPRGVACASQGTAAATGAALPGGAVACGAAGAGGIAAAAGGAAGSAGGSGGAGTAGGSAGGAMSSM